jgi:hypothetical protein
MNDALAQLKVAFLKELPAINDAIAGEIDALHPLVRPVAAHVMDASLPAPWTSGGTTCTPWPAPWNFCIRPP